MSMKDSSVFIYMSVCRLAMPYLARMKKFEITVSVLYSKHGASGTDVREPVDSEENF